MDLTGAWQLVFFRNASKTDSIVGEVVLMHSPWLTAKYDTSPRLYFGMYDVALGRWGTEVRNGRDAPMATAFVDADSVILQFNPFVDHGAVILTGRPAGNQIAGRWWVTMAVIGPQGSFVLRRER